MGITIKESVAIQAGGRLTEPSIAWLKREGIDARPPAEAGELQECNNRGDFRTITVLGARSSDIPAWVADRSVRFGVTGLDKVTESEAGFYPFWKLGFGLCRLVIAVPTGSDYQGPGDLQDARIATANPNTLERYLEGVGVSADIVYRRGKVEPAIALGAADAVCDITATGASLARYDLEPVATVLESQAVLLMRGTTR